MSDFEDLEVERPETVSSTIQLTSAKATCGFPKHIVQKKLRGSGLTGENSLKSATAPIQQNEKGSSGSETTQSAKKEISIQASFQEQPKANTQISETKEQKNSDSTISNTIILLSGWKESAQSFIADKYNKAIVVIAETLEPAKKLLSYAYQGIQGFCSVSYWKNKISQLTEKFMSLVRTTLDAASETAENQGSDGDTQRTNKRSWLHAFKTFLLGDDKDRIKIKSDTQQSFRTDLKDPIDFFEHKQEKTVFGVIIESLKKLAEAISEKNRQLEEQKKKDEFEKRREEQDKEAHRKLEEARNLRPDLVDELELPESDVLFASAFSQTPNVGLLIELAEQKKIIKEKERAGALSS